MSTMLFDNPLDGITLKFDCGHTLNISLAEIHGFRRQADLKAYVLSRQCPICSKHATDFLFDGYLR